MNLIKEVDYVFEYDFDGETITEKVNHFVDNIENRRYIWNQETEFPMYPNALSFKGTLDGFKEIKPLLIGEKSIVKTEREEVRILVFDLIDIPYLLICRATRRRIPNREVFELNINGTEQYFKKLD